MNRLSEGVIELNDIEVLNNCSYSCYMNIADALNVLKAYEDTGFEPETIKGLGKWIDELRKELRDYKNLEEQGLLIKMPCTLGDTVYFIKSAFSIAKFPIEAKVVSIRGINRASEVMYTSITNYNNINKNFTSKDIGKTVFLTREEAEKVIKTCQ